MIRYDGGSTSPTLLRRAVDWRDIPAWGELFDRYDPLLRGWCRVYLHDASGIDEVCQRVWIELADRLRSFRYDPARTFRGWLRDLCRFRAIDVLRERQREGRYLLPLDGRFDGASWPGEETIESDPHHDLMLREAALAQAAVRERVEPRTWETYWRIGVDGWTVSEAAATQGISYAAAFAAYKRVDRRLRDEGTRRLAALKKASAPPAPMDPTCPTVPPKRPSA
jgi:RNA polymerase sigma factor (sigma-70 family)